MQAHDLKISQKNYPKASKYSTIALALVIANIFCTLFGTFVIVALFTGLSFRGGLYGKCANLRFYDNGQGYIYSKYRCNVFNILFTLLDGTYTCKVVCGPSEIGTLYYKPLYGGQSLGPQNSVFL